MVNVIESQVATGSEAYHENASHFRQLIDSLYVRRRAARLGGGERARRRHVDSGKLLPRDRVRLLLDPGSPFLEIGDLAGDGMHDGIPPGAGLITGIGRVAGRVCMIICNDSTVKGGTYYGITAKKHVRAQKIAMKHRLPNLTLVDSGGANLTEQAQIFPDEGQYGTVFNQIVRQSAEGIPQLATVHGACTAGGAYVPALCDQTIIVRKQGHIHLGGPEITLAATGEVVDRETLGGAEMHSTVSGVTDHLADDDCHALLLMRELVADLPGRPMYHRPPIAVEEPLYDPNELYGIISNDPRKATDTREVLARILDGSRFDEFKPLYGNTLLCGFGHIMGFPVGIIANKGPLMSESSKKAVHFIDLCCKRNIPLFFMADVTGFMVGSTAERGGITKDGAKMITAMASANVPKYNLIIGGSYGAGYMGMCSRPFEPWFAFGWPNGRAALMGPEQAATTLAIVQRKRRDRDGCAWSEAEEEAFKEPIRKQFLDFASMENFAANLWIDGILDPTETRQTMGLALDMASRLPPVETPVGVLRI